MHLTGGVSGLAGTIVLGPRKGRFVNPEDFEPHNLPLAPGSYKALLNACLGYRMRLQKLQEVPHRKVGLLFTAVFDFLLLFFQKLRLFLARLLCGLAGMASTQVQPWE